MRQGGCQGVFGQDTQKLVLVDRKDLVNAVLLNIFDNHIPIVRNEGSVLNGDLYILATLSLVMSRAFSMFVHFAAIRAFDSSVTLLS